MQFSSFFFICATFGIEGCEINLHGLPYLLFQGHGNCNAVGFIVVFLIDGLMSEDEKCEDYKNLSNHSYILIDK